MLDIVESVWRPGMVPHDLLTLDDADLDISVALENGLPRIPTFLMDCVAFLYPTVEDAERHRKVGGTCFLIGNEVIEDGERTKAFVPYFVSNIHVVRNKRCPVIRINRRDGAEPDIIDVKIKDLDTAPARGRSRNPLHRKGDTADSPDHVHQHRTFRHAGAGRRVSDRRWRRRVHDWPIYQSSGPVRESVQRRALEISA